MRTPRRVRKAKVGLLQATIVIVSPFLFTRFLFESPLHTFGLENKAELKMRSARRSA